MSVYWILIEKSQAGKTHARRRGDAHTQPNYKLHAALRHSRLEQISHGSHSTRLTVDENIFQAGNITAALVKKSNSLIASPKKRGMRPLPPPTLMKDKKRWILSSTTEAQKTMKNHPEARKAPFMVQNHLGLKNDKHKPPKQRRSTVPYTPSSKQHLYTRGGHSGFHKSLQVG